MQKLLFKAFLAGHVNLYRLTGGRLGASMRGADVLLLSTLGRISGKPWTVPLMSIRHDGHTHVIASAGGSPEEPAWYKNLQSTPTVGVQEGDRRYRATAVILDGEERDAVYAAAEAVLDDFTTYAQKAGREIPVVRLVPIGA